MWYIIYIVFACVLVSIYNKTIKNELKTGGLFTW